MMVRLAAGTLIAAMSCATASAEKKYGPGVTDTEIKIGQTMAYSGPASMFGGVGRAEAAYFAKVNAEGGVNGRKINFISLDDAYTPPKTVEQVRRLVEQENVLLIFGSLGTASNLATRKYLNQKKVPQLFIAGASSSFGDPANYPWTMGWQPTASREGAIYGKYIARERPNAKIGVLYQNDDFGKDFLKGVREGLGDKAKLIVAEASYEITDPSIDSQILTLRGAGVDTFVDTSLSKFTAQAIRKVADIGWKPLHFIANSSSSVEAVLKSAGLEHAVGIITAAYLKDPNDAQWKDDPAMKAWFAWMKQYYPEGNTADWYNVFAYSMAESLVIVLKACGDDLSRENIMKQATNLRNVPLPLLLPGITLNTGPEDYFPIKQMRLQRFDGAKWVLFGDAIQ
jgi:ABC-type branched-subunit amino acid transport system substrate-binding protein